MRQLVEAVGAVRRADDVPEGHLVQASFDARLLPGLSSRVTRRQPMSNGATVAKQKQILANQRKILANQKRIEANQAKLDRVIRNQVKLDRILANQKRILSKLS
jgi:hypothetical protein